MSIPIQALTVREYEVDPDGNMIKKSDEEEDGSAGDDAEESEDSEKEEKAEKKDFEGVFRVVDGTVEFVAVETGIVGDVDIEVLSGLEEGESIVTGTYKTLRSLSDGDAVKPEDKERG